MNSKYDPLKRYLRDLPAKTGEITLTFEEASEILGFDLPKSARTYRAWWANQRNTTRRPQVEAWSATGFSVTEVNLG